MTKMTPLLERNEQFARGYRPSRSACPRHRCSSSPAWTTGSTPRSSSGCGSETLPSSATRAAASPRPSSTTSPTWRSSPVSCSAARGAGHALRGRGRPPHAVRHRLARRRQLPAPGRRGDRPRRGGAGSHRRRRPARHRQGRRRAPAHLAPALAEGQRVRPRVRRRHRARHHRDRRSVPLVRLDGSGGSTRWAGTGRAGMLARCPVLGQCRSGGPSGRGLPPVPAEAALKNR